MLNKITITTTEQMTVDTDSTKKALLLADKIEQERKSHFHHGETVKVTVTEPDKNQPDPKLIEDALRNMLGFFGGAEIKLTLGKRFTQTHADIIKQAREALGEYP